MQRLAKKKREREPVEKSGFYSSNIQRSNDKLKLKVQNILQAQILKIYGIISDSTFLRDMHMTVS